MQIHSGPPPEIGCISCGASVPVTNSHCDVCGKVVVRGMQGMVVSENPENDLVVKIKSPEKGPFNTPSFLLAMAGTIGYILALVLLNNSPDNLAEFDDYVSGLCIAVQALIIGTLLLFYAVIAKIKS